MLYYQEEYKRALVVTTEEDFTGEEGFELGLVRWYNLES